MKKVFNFLKKCIIVAMLCLLVSNVVIPLPSDFDPETGIPVCGASPNPDEEPLNPPEYN